MTRLTICRAARRLRRALGPLALALLMCAPSAAADTWLFDKQNASVRFTWDHLGLSRQSGRFLEVDGRLQFSPTDPEGGSVVVAIKTASLWTGVKEYDDNLKSESFFDADRYPIITFKSTGVRRTGEKAGEIDGELTIMGISRPVTLSTIWNFTGEHPFAAVNPTYKGKWVSGFSATATVLRSEWGLTRALPLISDEIRIAIEAEFLLKE
ncbi:MAG: YceI family protein [Hyphomicrobiaceae bacterium]|nr:YceI family protein [Hyphomicrobiaceae bacterium]